MRARTVRPGRVTSDFDLVRPPGPRVRRVVGQHVIRAVVLDDALERGREIVLVDDGETAGLLGQRAETVLGQAQLVLQRPLADAERCVVGERAELD